MKNNTHLLILALALTALLFTNACCPCDQNPKKRPIVQFKTDFGEFKAELYTDLAPISANNFMRYVRENRFQDAVFYRTVTMDNQPNDKVKIQVLQGGLYDDNNQYNLPPIPHETTQMTGTKHLDGTLSMARYTPGTADNDFSICIGDQPELDFNGKRNPDGQGFAAFGRVIQGMDVVRTMHQQNEKGQTLDPFIQIIEIKEIKE